MDGMSKRIREIKRQVEAEKLHVVRIDVGTHVKVRVSNGVGERMIVFPTSSGDHRAKLNQRTVLRRFAKEASA